MLLLVHQKSILTIQIQRQRELNSKSDAEKDAHVVDLSQQLVESSLFRTFEDILSPAAGVAEILCYYIHFV